MNKAIKLAKAFYFATILICINVLYYQWQPYYKALFRADFLVSDIITNIIYFIIFYCGILFLFKTKIKTDIVLDKKKVLMSFLIMFFIRVAIDCFKLMLYKMYIFNYINFVLEMVFICCVFFSFQKIFCKKIKPLSIKNAYVFLSIIIALIGIHIGFISYKENILEYCKAKYLDTSFIVQNGIKVLKNDIHIEALILETIFLITIFVLFILFNKEKKKPEKNDKRISKQFIRIGCVIVLCLIISFVKLCFIPHNGYPQTVSATQVIEPNAESNDFDSNLAVTKTKRINAETAEENSFVRSKIYFWRYDKTVTSLSLNAFFHDFTSDNPQGVRLDNYFISLKYGYLKDVMLNNTKVFYFGNKAIIFEQNEKVVFYKSENINDAKENEILTEMLKYLLQQGYVEYFEYGIEYLKKYDNDFIGEYIQRYSQGEFTQAELELNPDLRFEYITKLAVEHDV